MMPRPHLLFAYEPPKMKNILPYKGNIGIIIVIIVFLTFWGVLEQIVVMSSGS